MLVEQSRNASLGAPATNTTITAAVYWQQLERLQSKISVQRNEEDTGPTILLHDNARPHLCFGRCKIQFVTGDLLTMRILAPKDI